MQSHYRKSDFAWFLSHIVVMPDFNTDTITMTQSLFEHISGQAGVIGRQTISNHLNDPQEVTSSS